MRISIQSIKNYAIVNGFLFILTLLQSISCTYIHELPTIPLFSMVYFILIVRNYGILHFIEHGTRDKPLIRPDDIPKESYPYEFHFNLLSTTAVEAVTHVFVKERIINHSLSSQLVYFIPLSFAFEFVLDIFHYATHRLLHHKYFYAYLHKKHHTFSHPRSIIAFYQDPIDLFITVSVPTMIALLIIPSVSYFEFQLLMTYKVFTEISGHSGKKLAPTGCFPQCIWLPRSLSIELYTEDHDLHHSLNNCNYAKRFSFWDKVFGTYRAF